MDTRKQAGRLADAWAHGRMDLALRKRLEQSGDRQRIRVLVELLAGRGGARGLPAALSGARPIGGAARGLLAASLTCAEIEALSRQDSWVYRIWLDHPLQAQASPPSTHLRTVKADAALRAFAASGEGIVWAVCDTGIAAEHRHFATHKTLDLPPGLEHRSFLEGSAAKCARVDSHGHGTHMAALIAGEWGGRRGAAPEAKLLSLRVLDENAAGHTSALIEALDAVWQWNQGGRLVRIHGVNLSLGYEFDPEWFACGQSPLCVEVNRLVESGVVVVAAAGNAGYGAVQTVEGMRRAPLPLTINDPGNAELAITVGATHRDQPHIYGVSWFSSKGPTGDGRAKPDLVAPGEKVASAASAACGEARWQEAYVEDSGTSVAAAITSGALAAFLSARPEYIGKPRELKRIVLETCQDLGREKAFQGRGLLDVMKALQSV